MKASLVAPMDDISALNGKNINFTGYTVYITGTSTKYLYFFATSIEEIKASDEELLAEIKESILAKFFMPKEKAMCASLVMMPCYYYTYTLFYENFNCNILSMALWPMIAYYFYKSAKQDKTKDWIIFGIASALGTLAKYQVIFLMMSKMKIKLMKKIITKTKMKFYF